MKTSKILALMALAMTLAIAPAESQRPGGGGGGSRSSSSSHSSSSSRSSSSSMGSSRSSVSSSSRSSVSSPSHSASSSRSSVSSSSRSTSSTRGSVSTPRSSSHRSSVGENHRSAVGSTGSTTGRQPHNQALRSGARQAEVTGRHGIQPAPHGQVSVSHGPAGRGPREATAAPYARPGHPGGAMPPSSRPIHPAPYFHHPWHGHMVHCHPIYWSPIPPRPWYWPGFWGYCNSYWYDYHVTDVVVVHDYVQKTYSVDLVTYGISGDIMYAIVKDGGSTYLQVYDNNDHLLAEQKINKKYCNMVIDAENGGCWISKKNNKDPLLFIWAEGQLLIYEED